MKFVFILATVFLASNIFDEEEFKNKHYLWSGKETSTMDYFSNIEGSGYSHAKGYVCENLTLTKDDLENMSLISFTNEEDIFFKNCEIPFINQQFISKFPAARWIFFDSCNISFDNFGNNSPSTTWNKVNWLGFHDCEIFNSVKSLESVFKYLSALFLHIPLLNGFIHFPRKIKSISLIRKIRMWNSFQR